MEPPSSYVKGIVATIILTELFRVSDVALNWSFLSTHPDYATFFKVDLLYIFSGLVLAALSLSNVKVGLATGVAYSLAGVSLTLFDPDFPHFLRDPSNYILFMEPVVSLLFTLGTLVSLIMLIVALRGYVSLRLGALRNENY